MADFNPASYRLVPSIYTEEEVKEGIGRFVHEGEPFLLVGKVLDEYKPKGLSLALPFSWQLHFYAYKEASKRGIYTAVSMPTNTSALAGIMRSVPIDAILTTEEGAHNLEKELRERGELSRMRLWIILTPQQNKSTFTIDSGTVVHIPLP